MPNTFIRSQFKRSLCFPSALRMESGDIPLSTEQNMDHKHKHLRLPSGGPRFRAESPSAVHLTHWAPGTQVLLLFGKAQFLIVTGALQEHGWRLLSPTSQGCSFSSSRSQLKVSSVKSILTSKSTLAHSQPPSHPGGLVKIIK